MFYEQKNSSKNNYLSISQKISVNFSFPLHFHENYEFIYVEEGVLTVGISGFEFNVKSGEGALILPNQPHSFSTPEYSRAWLVIFSPDHLPELKKITSARGCFHPVIKPPMGNLRNLLIKAQDNALRLRSLLYELAALYCEGENFPILDTVDSSTVCKLVAYIDGHYTEQITLGDISRALGYNYRYTSGLVNKFFKLSLPQILSRYRVSHACKLLAESNRDITEIALLCGFGSVRSFNRSFKEVTGVAPREYKVKQKP